MSNSSLPTPAPVINPENEHFWKATAEGKLLLRKCNSCDSMIWYPRQICPECNSDATEWIEATGKGVIYSFTINHRGDGPYKDAAPFVIAYVELDEGPRMLSNVLSHPNTVEIGQAVTVVFDDTGTGVALPRFRPL